PQFSIRPTYTQCPVPSAPVGLTRSRRYHSRFARGSSFMQRRDFLKMAGLAAASSRVAGQQPQSFLAPTASTQDVAKTDFTLRIAPITVELAPNRIISTVGYNG